MTDNYIAIGDIHGRYDLLDALLAKCHDNGTCPHTGYKFVFLGDMVDRGPESWRVCARIKYLSDRGNAIALRGNHEDLMMEYYDNKIVDKHDLWFYNGGTKTAESYSKKMKMYGHASFFPAFGKSGHAEWIKTLPYFYETEKVWFSHAPIPKEQYRKRNGDFRTDIEALTWSWHGHHAITEQEFAHDHGKLAVCGHVHALREKILEPRIYPNIIYADTGSGCAPEAPLSAIVILDGKFKEFLQAKP